MQVQIRPAVPKTAVCVVGDARTFTSHHHNIHSSLLDAAFLSGVNLDFFFWLTNNHEQSNTKQKFYNHVNDSVLQAAIDLFHPQFSTIHGDTKFVKNTDCIVKKHFLKYDASCKSNCAKYIRWWETFMKLKQCMLQVINAEKRIGVSYVTVVRIRPDIIIYERFPPILQSKTPVFPHGKMCCGGHPCMNDHMVVLPRLMAPPYFYLVDAYINCHGVLEGVPYLDASWYPVLNKRFWNNSARGYRIPYTLVRPEGVSCKRASLSWYPAHAWQTNYTPFLFGKSWYDSVERKTCEDFCTKRGIAFCKDCE